MAHHSLRSPAPRRFHLGFAAAFLAATALYGSLVPLRFEPLPVELAVGRLREIATQEISFESRTDWGTNALLFVPIGFLALGSLSLDRRPTVAWFLTPVVAVVCLALSVGIEFAQNWFPPRVPSLNDVAAQAVGSLFGCTLWVAVGQAATEWARLYVSTTRAGRQIDWLLQAYFLGLLVYSLLPLDLTISLPELHDKYRAGRIRVVPFSYDYGSAAAALYQVAKDAVLFVPVGALAATTFLPSIRSVRPFISSLVLCAFAAASIEAMQVFAYSRVADVTDIVIGVAGGVLGICLARGLVAGRPAARSETRTKPRYAWLGWLAVVAVYAAALAALFLWPMDFSLDRATVKERLDGFFDVPFSKMYNGPIFESASNLVRKVLWFAPLGTAFAVTVDRAALPPSGRWVCGWLSGFACLVIAACIELAQVFSPEHYPDVTDVLIYSLGSILGLLVATRALRAWRRSAGGGTAIPRERPRDSGLDGKSSLPHR